MSEDTTESIYSDQQVTRAARDIIKIERDCFYGDAIERERLKKIREKLDLIFIESYARGED